MKVPAWFFCFINLSLFTFVEGSLLFGGTAREASLPTLEPPRGIFLPPLAYIYDRWLSVTTERYSLKAIVAYPYRLQLKGCSQAANGESCLFFIDEGKGLCSCVVGKEQAKHGFSVKSFNMNQHEAKIFDAIGRQTIDLKLGEVAYTNRFQIEVYDAHLRKCFRFHEKGETRKVAPRTLLTLLDFDAAKKKVILVEESNGQQPLVLVLKELQPSNEFSALH